MPSRFTTSARSSRCSMITSNKTPSPCRRIAIRFADVTRAFSGYTAVEGITLEVPDGSFVAVVGPSGCGKSRLLNLAAGLLPPTKGSIAVFGEPLAGLNRRATYMFQQDALLPWKTVLDNVALGLTFRGRTRPERKELGRAWLDRVGLRGFAA